MWIIYRNIRKIIRKRYFVIVFLFFKYKYFAVRIRGFFFLSFLHPRRQLLWFYTHIRIKIIRIVCYRTLYFHTCLLLNFTLKLQSKRNDETTMKFVYDKINYTRRFLLFLPLVLKIVFKLLIFNSQISSVIIAKI